MAQVPVQRFSLGDTAWFFDGRSGTVILVEFNPNTRAWQYVLDPQGGAFQDSDLFLSDPTFVDVVPSLPPPSVIVVPSLNVESVQRMIDTSLAAAITGLLATMDAKDAEVLAGAEALLDRRAEALSNSIIRNVTQLSEIQSSLQEQEVAANETGPDGISGFVRRAGAFLAAPFTSLLDVVETWLVREVTDGFNR